MAAGLIHGYLQDVTDFEQSFVLAVEELRKFGRIVVDHDSMYVISRGPMRPAKPLFLT